MNKKIMMLSVLAIGIFFLTGCAKQQAQINELSKKPQVTEEQPQSTIAKTINSIADAMGLQEQMKCTYKTTFENGEVIESTAYIDGKKFSSVGTVNGTKSYAVSDGETMYTWMENQKTGMKFTFACAQEAKSTYESSTGKDMVADAQDVFKDATETKCEPSSDGTFTVPSDITFNDQCEMMKKAGEMMKNLPKNPGATPQGMPKGTPPSMPTGSIPIPENASL